MFKPTEHLKNQLLLPGDFFLPFGGKLNENNRWVQLVQLVPWEYAEKNYGRLFKNTLRGQQTLSLRMGLGALIIQERMQLTDRETVESITENPYMQYFIGLTGFQMKPPFHHSMMTHFRKRLKDVLAELNDIVATEGVKAVRDDHDDDDANHGTGGRSKRSSKKNDLSTDAAEQQTMFTSAEATSNTTSADVQEQQLANEASAVQEVANETPSPILSGNEGSLLLDSTCAPADIAYPTDVNLLNEAREKLEAIIDTLHKPVIGQVAKPRTYREKARRQYLAVSKQRRPGAESHSQSYPASTGLHWA